MQAMRFVRCRAASPLQRSNASTATDYDALMDARGEALAAQYGGDNAAGEEFTSICGNHHDYLWDVVHEKQASN